MKVYVAMICDRHSNPEPYLLSDAQAAIDFARDQANSLAYDPLVVEEEPIGGWLYHATYSGEGDSVWVIEREIEMAAEEETP
jgi:hypothetical protein